MSSGWSIEVDTSQVDHLVDAGVRAITRTVQMMAEHLGEEDIPTEAPKGETGALSEPWKVSARDPLTWVVVPSDEAWYAHIVAGGSRPHGPTRRRAMTVEDRFVTHVSGTPADPFDRRAVASAERAGDQLLAEALTREGIL